MLQPEIFTPTPSPRGLGTFCFVSCLFVFLQREEGGKRGREGGKGGGRERKMAVPLIYAFVGWFSSMS